MVICGSFASDGCGAGCCDSFSSKRLLIFEGGVGRLSTLSCCSSDSILALSDGELIDLGDDGRVRNRSHISRLTVAVDDDNGNSSGEIDFFDLDPDCGDAGSDDEGG